ncbi:hypothetical protein ASPCAL10250 [Aspergillus calidoustus]|uniref:Uncharacterized protein n=1 Tax=Aspergillus calidoustus TaxID=454130 RepID=A0A0U5G916_ASPCI|nr:hypothetical protein ASPCAL10250 [Aspergillus calidoustus]
MKLSSSTRETAKRKAGEYPGAGCRVRTARTTGCDTGLSARCVCPNEDDRLHPDMGNHDLDLPPINGLQLKSGLLVASTLAPQSQHELGLVQAWSARSPGREVCALSGTRLRALADSQPCVRSVPDQEGRINHRRVTSVPRVPDSRSRGGANARVSSAAPSGRLRCQRCCGTRSRTYHCRHFRDPIAYLRRTGCANAKILKERS